MRSVSRELAPQLLKAARGFSSLVITGPRRAGKTYALRHAFPGAEYQLLEDPDTLARISSDPRGWLEDLRRPVILDEIQNAPQLLAYVRSRIDAAPSRRGDYILTGSQDFALMKGVTESLAGRAGIFQLLPFSFREVKKWNLVLGGFPEVHQRPRNAAAWFRSYVQTYLERDVRAVTAVHDLGTFRRFMGLLATRTGQLLNRTDLAGPLGVSVPTINQWLSVLETTGVAILVPPYFENLEKRLVKSPKVYWVDSGLLCHLLGFDSMRALERSAFIGPVFESFIASELIKNQVHGGGRRELYHFRDQQGLEVDFVVPAPAGRVDLIEAKWTRTPTPQMAKPMVALLSRFGPRKVRGILVHRGSPSMAQEGTLAPGVRAMSVERLLS
jgi:predicted AAA+ superfamily ATPase